MADGRSCLRSGAALKRNGRRAPMLLLQLVALVLQVSCVSRLLGTALAAGPGEADRYLHAGIRAYHVGRRNFDPEPLDRAKKLLARAVELRPSPEGFFFLGGTLGLLARPRAAARAYLASLRLDPSAASAHQNLAQVFDDLKNRSAALAHYRLWAKLEPKSADARRALAISHLWNGNAEEGARLCDEATKLAPSDPSVPFDCAQMLVLLLPPTEVLPDAANSGRGGTDTSVAEGDASSEHYAGIIQPLFVRAQQVAFSAWRGGFQPSLEQSSSGDVLRWSALPEPCRDGAHAIRDWKSGNLDTIVHVTGGGDIYGQRVPETIGGPFTWAGQRYVERGVQIATLRNVVISGNEGVITRGCDVYVPYYDVQIPWHENLPQARAPEEPVRHLQTALWLLVLFPANFFSFLVDELARLVAWLTVMRQRVPLLVPADRGKLKPFMYDWFNLLGGFEVIPYDIRPHFMGAASVSSPRFFVSELQIVDWRDPASVERRADVFLLPPRWAVMRLRDLAVNLSYGAENRPRIGRKVRTLLWIQRAIATTRRVENEDELLLALENVLRDVPGLPWEIKIYSDSPATPGARETVKIFQDAEVVVGVHGSGQANMIFCRSGTGVIDINLPEPHSQYSAHNSYALGLRYRLVMLRGVGLHQALNLTVPVADVVVALRSLVG
eukprot:TRINITY_DN11786_c0_g7_i1.p1 TRINITY_DN11786_c0_g7~~TRINITY_DN11786_c0_g7_i1.p1  ORF type:complete len:668 (+),score=142.14 TRINITY_DN11786_c0_g7_i1:58-2061(+)